MKKLIYILITFCFSCTNNNEPIPTYYQDLEKLREINDQLIKSNPKDQGTIYELGITIKNQSLNLYVRYHKIFLLKKMSFYYNVLQLVLKQLKI